MSSQPPPNRRRTFSTLSKASRGSLSSRSIQENHPFNNGVVDSDSTRKVSSVNASVVITASSNTAEPTSSAQVAQNAEVEARLRSELRYYFMTPCEKWRYRRKLPMKICIQLLKVVLVTALIIIYGSYRAAYISYLQTLQSSLEHLYLYKWSATYETPPYPPSAGTYAVYTQDDFYNAVDYTFSQYNATQALETDTFQIFREANTTQIAPPRFCISQYRSSQVSASNRTIRVDMDKYTWCIDVQPVNGTSGSLTYDIRRFLAAEKNITGLQFEAVDKVRIGLAFVSVKPPVAEFAYWATDCYCVNASVVFDNTARSGQIPITLKLHVGLIKCDASIESDRNALSLYHYVACGLVIGFCSLSLVLCLRSLRRGYRLMRTTAQHFETVLGQPLPYEDRFEFVDLWFVLVIISDVMAICGSVMKLRIDMHASYAYDWCSVVLGIAGVLVWFGLLRYLAFFAGYSDLMLTMKRAAPNMARYLTCGITMFLGFLFCGWVVIGPYHFKMRTLSSTAECLFSLLNGDDMFATFSNLSLDVASTYVEVFLRVYLYSFISMFIYMVLAVFLSVILDVYETVKQTGTSTLRQAKAESSDMFKFIYRLDDDDSIAVRQQMRDRPSGATTSARGHLPNGGSVNRSVSRDSEDNIRERGCLLGRCCCPSADDADA